MAEHRRRRTGTSGRALRYSSADPAELVPWHRPLPRLPRGMAITAGVLAALSLGLPNIAPGIPFMSDPGSPVRLFFGLSEEMNLPTFFSVLTVLSTATALAVVGALTGGRTGSAFLVTAGMVGLLAFDDFAALHERLNGLGAVLLSSDDARYTWMLPAALVALLVVAAFWRVVAHVDPGSRRLILLGIFLFFGAALGLEAVSGLLDRPGTNGMPLQLATHVEEVSENLGMILVMRGALGMLEVSRFRPGLTLRIAGSAPHPRTPRTPPARPPAPRAEPVPQADPVRLPQPRSASQPRLAPLPRRVPHRIPSVPAPRGAPLPVPQPVPLRSRRAQEPSRG